MEDGAHLVGKVFATQLDRGHVDGDAQLPARMSEVERTDLAAGRLEHPATDRHDQPRLLGDGDELGRTHHAGGSLPAGERFHCDNLTRREVEDRLVVDAQLAAIERLGQVLAHAQPSYGGFAHVRCVDGALPLAERLGGVHRDVRVAKRLFGAALESIGEGDADARRW